MTVHWHDDECTWCPCDEVTTGDPERLAAWMRASRLGPVPSSSVGGTTTSEEQSHG